MTDALLLDSPSPLLDRLQTLADCPRAEGYACITARREHGASSVSIEGPTLAIVLSGQKWLRGAGIDLTIDPGELFLVTRSCRIDVMNRPDAHNGLYLTLTIPLCAEVIDAARLLWSVPVVQGGDSIIAMPAARLEADLMAWSGALQAARYGEARLALAAMLVRLCGWGHTAMLVPPPPSLAMQVQALVSAQPERDWRSVDFEAALGMSGATLRRRLAAEHTSLSDAITEARLAHAMTLLYTTRWPVKTVAGRVGYRSSASFVRRFVARYGLQPGDIGNAEA